MSHRKPTLYRDGAEWSVWVSEDAQGRVYVHTRWGKTGGKLQQGTREVEDAGRHDTALDAAKHLASKKWIDHQSKQGYQTRERQSQAESDDAQPRKRARKSSVSRGGANAVALETPVLPMLANTAVMDRVAGTVKDISWPAAAQPKIDGFRCVARVAGGAKLFSRKNIEYQGLESLRTSINKLRVDGSGGFGSGRLYLDGELYVDTGGDFGKLSSLVKKGQNRVGYEVDNLVYRVFDCFDLDHMETVFAYRHEFLAGLLEGADPAIELLETVVVRSLADVDAKMAAWLADGHEGLMLRELGSPYVMRKRSKWLVKHKEFVDSEFEIVGHKEGSGSDKGTVVWICKTDNGSQTFAVRPMGSRAHRAEMFDNAESYHGRLLTVKYQELSPDGVPRFPVGKEVREEWDLAAEL